MKAGMARVALVASCILPSSGCTVLSPVRVSTETYVLNRLPPDLPAAQARAASLLVLAPGSGRIYDTTRMAYTSQAYQIAYFSQNEWAETPSQMMLPLIVATLSNTHCFEQVITAPDFGHHTFVLRSEILELKQDFTADPAILKFTMRFYLRREATNEIVATREISEREVMRQKNPYAGVVAANQATAKLLQDLAAFVIDKAR